MSKSKTENQTNKVNPDLIKKEIESATNEIVKIDDEIESYKPILAKIEQLKTRKESLRNVVIDNLNQSKIKVLDTGNYIVEDSSYSKSQFDGKSFKEDYPDLDKKYTKSITIKKLTIQNKLFKGEK